MQEPYKPFSLFLETVTGSESYLVKEEEKETGEGWEGVER